MSSTTMINQLTLENAVLTFGITTILLLGTTLYYINQRNNSNNDDSGVAEEEESVKELDRSVSLMYFWFCFFLYCNFAVLC